MDIVQASGLGYDVPQALIVSEGCSYVESLGIEVEMGEEQCVLPSVFLRFHAPGILVVSATSTSSPITLYGDVLKARTPATIVGDTIDMKK